MKARAPRGKSAKRITHKGGGGDTKSNPNKVIICRKKGKEQKGEDAQLQEEMKLRGGYILDGLSSGFDSL